MPQSLSQVWVHIIFSTKGRRPFLQEESSRNQMFRMLSHEVKELDCVSASVGGYVDHVHLLVGLSRTITISKFVEGVKTKASKWAKKALPGATEFHWQAGYGAFSVSQSQTSVVHDYILNQATHHAKMSYQDEFRRICERHGVLFDEKYVWD